MPRKRILVIEDQDSLLKLESILLTAKGFEVKAVADGQGALDALNEEFPDLVLLDIMLPDLDGFEICRRIKEDPENRHVPVIIVTAKKTREDMDLGKKVGADAYITKPFKSAMLIESIQRLLAKKEPIARTDP